MSSFKGERHKKFIPYFFMAPAIFLIGTFLLYPILNVFYYSMQVYNANKPWANRFAGFENFKEIFTADSVFYPSLWVSIQWVFSEVFLQLIFGLIIGLLLDKTFRWRGLIRAAVFSPWAISGVLTSMMWSLMYNQQMGVINDVFMKLGLIDRHLAWVANINLVFGSVVVAELWRGIPFFAIMILAGLQTIPADHYEACKVDGGKPRHEFTYIILPALKESIILSTLLRTVWEFNNVDLIFTLTGGGPAYATNTLVMYVANTAIRYNDFGYGCALAVIVFFILMSFAILYLKLTNYAKEEH